MSMRSHSKKLHKEAEELSVNLCQRNQSATANSLARCGTAPPTGHSGLSRTTVFYGFLWPQIRV